MSDTPVKYTWQTLPNPFLNIADRSEVITGHVSGRKNDITFIITGQQSAIIVMGAPRIGKSTLIRYLQRSPTASWSWRNELVLPQIPSETIHFVVIDLVPLETLDKPNELLSTFITQCVAALQSIYPPQERLFSPDMLGLRKLLSVPNTRYFLIFDTIDRLSKPTKPLSSLERVWVLQEQGLELLEHCGAIHTLVDLIDDFNNFGVLLSLQSFPRPKITNQFDYVSADLARFTNMILQSLTWEDTEKFLAQPPENFGANWAEAFQRLEATELFSAEEQKWIRDQVGTHPYLLHQYCLYTFRLKQEYAHIHGAWTELDEIDKIDKRAKQHLTERMNERLNPFFESTWKRLQEALEHSSQATKKGFDDFIKSLVQRQTNDVIEPAAWDQLGAELRYILYSEGLVRYNQLQDIHFPGAILRDYLVQKVQETSSQPTPPSLPSTPSAVRGYWVRISVPGKKDDRISVTELEYRLLKTLIEHAGHCTETELMLGGWQKAVDRSTFTQRMHHLRKKLKARCGGEEVIGNRYGGLYSLNHLEWFHLE